MSSQWIEPSTGVREFMDSIPVGDSDLFFVPRLRHVDQFIFNISLPSLNSTFSFTYHHFLRLSCQAKGLVSFDLSSVFLRTQHLWSRQSVRSLFWAGGSNLVADGGIVLLLNPETAVQREKHCTHCVLLRFGVG